MTTINIAPETPLFPAININPDIADDCLLSHTALTTTTPTADPTTYAAAISSPNAAHWHAAMLDELRSLQEHGTWRLAELPAGRRSIGCKWVYKTKRDESGAVTRYKARLVAQGFSQREGIDFGATFAPVVRLDTLRIILALACHLDLHLYQLDIKTAYLNGDLDEDIYMRQPPGFAAPESAHLVCHLDKALYGLRQAGRAWNLKLDAVLGAIGLKRTTHDSCLYHLAKNNAILLLAIYVDDIIIATDCQALAQGVKDALREHFAVTDQGNLKFCLGMLVTRDRQMSHDECDAGGVHHCTDLPSLSSC
jgi:hypothetical protein